MRLPDLIPYLKDSNKWSSLLEKLNINEYCEEVLVYFFEKLEIQNEILLIEIEKSNDDLEININGKKYIQLFPVSLLKELVLQDFKNLENEINVAEKLIEYRKNDA